MDDKKKEDIFKILMNSFEEISEATNNCKGKRPPSFIMGSIAEDCIDDIEEVMNNKKKKSDE